MASFRNNCNLPGCGKPVVFGQRFCPAHIELGPQVEAGLVTYDPKKAKAKAVAAEGLSAMELMEIAAKQKEEKRRKKRDAKQHHMRQALNSGNAHEFLKEKVIEKLRKKGKIEKVFAEIDLDGNGTIDFEELKVCLKGMGYPMTREDMKYMMSQVRSTCISSEYIYITHACMKYEKVNSCDSLYSMKIQSYRYSSTNIVHLWYGNEIVHVIYQYKYLLVWYEGKVMHVIDQEYAFHFILHTYIHQYIIYIIHTCGSNVKVFIPCILS